MKTYRFAQSYWMTHGGERRFYCAGKKQAAEFFRLYASGPAWKLEPIPNPS